MAFCLNLMSLLIVFGYGAYDSYEPNPLLDFVLGPLSALAAGLGEEVLLVGALTVVAERAGWSTARLYLVAVGLRIAFHVYYGFAVLALIPWAVVAVWLFRRTRTVLPLVACHALWNTAVAWPQPLGVVLYWGVPIVGAVLLSRAWRRRPVAVRSG